MQTISVHHQITRLEYLNCLYFMFYLYSPDDNSIKTIKINVEKLQIFYNHLIMTSDPIWLQSQLVYKWAIQNSWIMLIEILFVTRNLILTLWVIPLKFSSSSALQSRARPRNSDNRATETAAALVPSGNEQLCRMKGPLGWWKFRNYDPLF